LPEAYPPHPLSSRQVDLVKDRKVESEEASDYARSQNLLYMETSAKGDNNVEKLFIEVAKRVPKTGAVVRKDIVNVAKATAPQAAGKKGCC
jgi:Ras-related protein Rab-18